MTSLNYFMSFMVNAI